MGVVFDQVPAVNRIVCGYRPVTTRVTLTIAESAESRAAFVENSKVTVYWNDVEVGVMRVDWNSRTELTAGNWEYIYDVDVQRWAQNEMLPKRGAVSGVFGVMGEKRLGDYSSDASGEVRFEISFFYRDDDNLLKLLSEPPEGFGNDALVTVPFALPQNVDSLLYGDGLYIYQNSGDVIRFLTDMPDSGISVDIDDNAWLSFIHNGDFSTLNAYRVRLYNSAGSVIDSKIMKLDVFITEDKERIVTFGSGVVQINDAVGNADFWNQSVGLSIDYSVAYYLIDVGYADSGILGLFESRSEVLRYNIRKVGEARSFRVHFLNRFGMADAFTFDCKRERRLNVRSSIGKKSLDWNMNSGVVAISGQHSASDYGKFRFDVKSNVAYDLEVIGIDDSVRLWLEGLNDSVETYFEDKDVGKLIRVNIEDVSNDLVEDSEDFATDFRLTVSFSNDVIKQRL